MKLLSSSKHATHLLHRQYYIIKVVLVSSRPARLTAAAQAASTLLHPLRWSQVYTPSLLSGHPYYGHPYYMAILTVAIPTLAHFTMATIASRRSTCHSCRAPT